MAEWSRGRALFEAVLDHEAARRAEFLRAECGSDLERLSRGEQLLRADERVATGAVEIDRSIASDLASQPVAGSIDRIGAYRIRRVLGSGGMSTVFEAEQ
jgi:hypothetical protein